ncbi:DUF134 domain-containing protein [Sulfurovum sp.]|uniref:DUF134 domain-containing protein n=1 Tax=Sulfurovum sp. TaxID=1969726 RepID=UPI0025CCAEE8|nr:DUF134 domain-containing protein [Sulfurovum sp.]
MRGRRKIKRVIDADHSDVCFKPCGIRKVDLESVVLLEDEVEALRLSDFEGLYQQECADKMGISRSTFSRILEKAHKKISDALLHGKAISINKKTIKETK